jgi:glycosyltransferase involved in cell wall biosynthesis
MGRHLVHVVPERFGAGVKTKLIESMACGTPFVTSSIGAQGLHLGTLAEHLVADDPDRFVELTEALLDDPVHWTFVQGELCRLAALHFSPAVLHDSLVTLMAELGAAPPVPR